MAEGIFITATGTDVGKTYVTARIIKTLRDAGVDAAYYKAALSGIERREGCRIAGDAEAVYRFAGLEGDPNQAVTTILDYPESPHLSAEMEGQNITLEPILRDYEKMAEKSDFVVMEGSGGIICPLNLKGKPLMLADVIKALSLDLIIVADAGLGTINSTLLTLEYAKSIGIQTRGIILNRFDKHAVIHEDNRRVLENMTGLPITCCGINGSLEACFVKKLLLPSKGLDSAGGLQV